MEVLVDEARRMIASGRWEAEFLHGKRRSAGTSARP
jgi:hypothetical protein